MLVPERLDVAAGLGAVARAEAERADGGQRLGDRRDAQAAEADAEHRGGQPLAAQHLDHRVRGVAPDHHQHEHEQQGPVPNHRPAGVPAKLILAQIRLRWREEVSRIQRVIARGTPTDSRATRWCRTS